MPTSYTHRTYTLRSSMVDALDRYVERGQIPGGFLQAALCNDLMSTVRRADEDNASNLPALAAYIYNEMPHEAHGSPDAVQAWINRFRPSDPASLEKID